MGQGHNQGGWDGLGKQSAHGRVVGSGLGYDRHLFELTTNRYFGCFQQTVTSSAYEAPKPEAGDCVNFSPDNKHIKYFDDRSGLWMGGWDGPGSTTSLQTNISQQNLARMGGRDGSGTIPGTYITIPQASAGQDGKGLGYATNQASNYNNFRPWFGGWDGPGN
ncbi:hypothetical protein BDV37DRAFT_284213 [Aspergillus pseudonomiae]|uniref:Uncharacterized protein n=1 Tax=Aspergillus pseudonomiae TaxID=1506151 RepID=A0A5N7D9D3_9EURO|nr:uncharacterized protein BDV37DRAFT_284213 [Aspergillus pseudonomiae]KAE8402887.1 hypothetical protein BDV37DRAFT_284213 [Aspergillus pseudonomiae]